MRIMRSIALLSLLAAPMAFADTINVSSTGAGATTPGGADPNYTVTTPGGTTTQAIVIAPNSAWGAQPSFNPGGNNWINASGSGTSTDPAGTYLYTTTFSLSGDLPNTAEIIGSFASDNGSFIELNGVPTGFVDPYGPPYSFNQFVSFDITGGFVDGTNTLTFVVMNGNGTTDLAGPTGLIVNIDSATASPVPEPASIALLGSGLLSVAGMARRKFRRS